VSADTDEILTHLDGDVGFLTLNRPKAINSLTQTMVTAMDAILTAWATDDAVKSVIVSGAGERGLCAGGDVVAIYHSAQAGGAEANAVGGEVVGGTIGVPFSAGDPGGY